MTDGTKKDEGFASRWSRLKQDARRPEEPSLPTPVPEPTPPAAVETGKQEDEVDLTQLPPIESLGKDSDFSIFMRKGVPEELRRLALRRMWQADPSLAPADMFEPYIGDFNNVETFADGLKTFYPEIRKRLDEEAE